MGGRARPSRLRATGRGLGVLLSGLVLLGCSWRPAPLPPAVSATASLMTAQAALAKGDYVQAHQLYAQLAELDDPVAEFSLGLFAQLGWGRPIDELHACEHFARAAALSVPVATAYWARCHDLGIGREVNLAKAVQLYLRAAELGLESARCAAADVYLDSRWEGFNPQRGLQLCQALADAGDVAAGLKVAQYQHQGPAPIRDVGAARRRLEQLAPVSPEAAYRLGMLLAEEYSGPPGHGPATAWLESAARRGYPPAYAAVAAAYCSRSPDLVTQPLSADDLALAYMWLEVARIHGRETSAPLSDWREAVLTVMPGSWREPLDQRVTAFLRRFPVVPDPASSPPHQAPPML